MRTEEVLVALATGIWRWDSASGSIVLDAEAARLIGLPAEPAVLPESAVRARFHPMDWIEAQALARLAITEGTPAETRSRVVDEQGRVLRTLRTRSRTEAVTAEDGLLRMVGTFQEITEPMPGTSAARAISGDLRRSREAFLLDAGRALAEAGSTSEVLQVVTKLSLPGFQPNGMAVLAVEGERIRIIGHYGQSPGDEEPALTLTLADTAHPPVEVVRTGQAVYVPTPEEYRKRFPEAWRLLERFDSHSWAFLPLTSGGRVTGVWMAAFDDPVGFTPDERSVLSTVARMLAQALARASAHETERELSDGLQRSMLPSAKPDIPGLAVAARYVPTGGGLQVGGDWYDVIDLPSGRTALVIGDVQGHDVRAAGLMGQLRIALRAYAAEGHHPDAVLCRASHFLSGLTRSEDGDDPRFATCLYVEIDPATGFMDVARAGHGDPAIRHPDGAVTTWHTSGGLPLGIDPDSDYPTTRIGLAPGETLLMCTDGLIETGGHDLDTGWQRIRAVCEEHASVDTGDLESLADALVQAVHGPASHHTTGPLADRREDDIALLLVSRDGALCPEGPNGGAIRRTAMTVAQAEPERVADCRHQLRELLDDWADPEQVESAVLLLSELVTNVLVHTDGDALLLAEVTGERDGRTLRLDVADGSDELPHRRRPGELASSGRGLWLLDMLADTWGVDPRGPGKAIWFRLDERSPDRPDGAEGPDEHPEAEFWLPGGFESVEPLT
ncbi:ATP-binding SpoIIE family protein phosphatase [Streptomyces palmae]|uniref:protein-serine/threonine phosphatase n=1 Tax=Streptomyces palmae TaxID=1701085 RepID=A0A4Z0GQL0_9ACTN|nr:SpoIIE family protein phosphatase [Streptomyces palmae]TGA98417.1 GAF domain-containing protein [Streptomyces palmae]